MHAAEKRKQGKFISAQFLHGRVLKNGHFSRVRLKKKKKKAELMIATNHFACAVDMHMDVLDRFTGNLEPKTHNTSLYPPLFLAERGFDSFSKNTT